MARERSRSAPPSFPVVVPSMLGGSDEEETSGLSDLQKRLRRLRRFREASACAAGLIASKQPAAAAAGDQAACADDLTAAKQPAAAAAVPSFHVQIGAQP